MPLRPNHLTTEEATQFVGSVEGRLRELLGDETDDGGPEGRRVLGRATRHLTLATAAKRARPRLVHHFGSILGIGSDPLCDIAVAAELVHTASLLHDDVIDDGTERRDQATVNQKWDTISAVLGGDSLLCSALKHLERFPPPVTARAVDVVAEMTESIMHEVRSRGRVDLDRHDWYVVADGKTASLFGWCGAAPALAADSPSDAERFATCGRFLGLAFQLADDLKDLTWDDAGKDRYADIRNGNPSYPIICAIDDDPAIGEEIEALRAGDERAPSASEIVEVISETDALDETRFRIRAEVERALEALGTDIRRAGGRQIAAWANTLCERI